MTTNTDLADALREIANTLPLGSALIVRLAANRLTTVAEGDGWIEWDGSKYEKDTEDLFTPVPRGTLVDVRFRDGMVYERVEAGVSLTKPRDAAGAYWENEGATNDIIAYRIVK